MLGVVARTVGQAEVIEEFSSIPASREVDKKVMLAEMLPIQIMSKSSEGRLEEGGHFGVVALVLFQSSARYKSDYRYCTLTSVIPDDLGLTRSVGAKMRVRVHRERSLLCNANAPVVMGVVAQGLVLLMQDKTIGVIK